jgi:hypothetical protein
VPLNFWEFMKNCQLFTSSDNTLVIRYVVCGRCVYVCHHLTIIWYCDMTPESPNSSLLDNGSLGTFPQQRIRVCISDCCYEFSILSTGRNKHRIIVEELGVVTFIRSSLKL